MKSLIELGAMLEGVMRGVPGKGLGKKTGPRDGSGEGKSQTGSLRFCDKTKKWYGKGKDGEKGFGVGDKYTDPEGKEKKIENEADAQAAAKMYADG